MYQPYLFPEMELEQCTHPVNVAKVPQRSPFRYPGGKTWLVPLFRRWMLQFANTPKILIEPFAGGGIIGLTAAFENLAKKVVLVELDDQVAAVWRTILGGEADWLAQRILDFDMTLENAKREFLKKPFLCREKAFQTILRNRTAHGGILAEGAGVLKNGENGKGILSRWYPKTIARRIHNISQVADRIHFIHGDAFDVLAQYQNKPGAVFFIDPPYTAGGKRAGARLYNHCQIDHERLFKLCGALVGDFLMTYDKTEEVRMLADRHGFTTQPVAMKNTHHAEMNELLIGRNLGWIGEGLVACESGARYGKKASGKRKSREIHTKQDAKPMPPRR
jgi:DNA adenine methylase